MNRFSLKQLKEENKLLIIGDIATNHCGDINHGLDIINSFHEVIKDYSEFYFSFKFQYRDIKNSFIHKHYKDRMDIKYVKRFTEGYLSDEEFLTLKNRVNELGYLTSCTPFDNISVQKIIEHDFDILKIGSVSMNDWILIEDVVKVNKPIIISTASHPLETINKLYSFMNHREKDFAFLHCRGIYPTPRKNMELNQIDLLKENFLNIPIGLSSHEDLFEGDSIVKIAVGKGVNILERHIDIDCKTKNAYSMTPKEMRLWLDGILEAQEICGIKRKRYKSSEKEQKDLAQFRRGLFAKEDLKLEDKLTNDNIYLAWPIVEDQVCANDFSKYTDFILKKNVKGIIELNMFYAFKELTGGERKLNYVKTVDNISLNLGVPQEQVERNIRELETKNIIKITDKFINLVDKEKFNKIIEGNVFFKRLNRSSSSSFAYIFSGKMPVLIKKNKLLPFPAPISIRLNVLGF